VTVAKSLAGGFPLSGVIGRAAVMDAVEPGGLGGTYGGSPIGCAAALAVLDVIRDERLVERAQGIGRTIRARLEPRGLKLRGLGAMLAFDLADAPAAKALAARALDEGVIVLTCGTHGQTVRLLPPLTIPDEVLEEGLAALVRATQPG
jgi:4-aminobutyrate aminotransferase/(S)-3-amino-2-methylpropionate transaminase